MNANSDGKSRLTGVVRGLGRALLACGSCIWQGGKLGALAGAGLGILSALVLALDEHPNSLQDWIVLLLQGTALVTALGIASGLFFGTFIGVVIGGLTAGHEMLGRKTRTLDSALAGGATEVMPAPAPRGRGDEAAALGRGDGGWRHKRPARSIHGPG